MTKIHPHLTVNSYSEKSAAIQESEAICTLGEPGCSDRYPNDLQKRELTVLNKNAFSQADYLATWVAAPVVIAAFAVAMLFIRHLQTRRTSPEQERLFRNQQNMARIILINQIQIKCQQYRLDIERILRQHRNPNPLEP